MTKAGAFNDNDRECYPTEFRLEGTPDFAKEALILILLPTLLSIWGMSTLDTERRADAAIHRAILSSQASLAAHYGCLPTSRLATVLRSMSITKRLLPAVPKIAASSGAFDGPYGVGSGRAAFGSPTRLAVITSCRLRRPTTVQRTVVHRLEWSFGAPRGILDDRRPRCPGGCQNWKAASALGANVS